MLDLAPDQANLVFLVLVAPICLWVIYTDLSAMRIPNKAVLALVGIFAVAGLLVLPFSEWLHRWPNLVVLLLVGIILMMVGQFGAGDMKFAAASAPFIAPAHASFAMILLAAFLLGGLAAHQLIGRIAPLRNFAPEWKSWSLRRWVPAGIALAGTLLTYLSLVAFPSLAGALASIRM